MEKMRNFWLAILASCVFGTLLYSACDFSEFDKDFAKASTKDKQRLHNDIKGVYIKAVVNDETECKIESLKRLIIANKALGGEYASFEAELKTLEPSKKPEPKENKANNASQKNAKTENSSKDGQNARIIGISNEEDKLTIKLNTKDAQIKKFALKSKDNIRVIYDIKGVLGTSTPALAKSDLAQKIRIAQTDPQTVRIVFESQKEPKIFLEKDEQTLIFSAESKAKTASKEQEKSTKTANKTEQKTQKTANKTEPKEQEKSAKTQSPKPEINQSLALSKKERASKIIVIDPGHGGDDAGAVSQNKKLHEKNIVLSVSKKAANLLKERGYKVFYTRSNDRFIKLRARTSFANDKNAHLFISVHANAAPNKEKAKSMSGIETFFLSPSRSERSMNAANLENKADTDEMNYFTKISFLNFLNREKIIASNKLAIDMQAALLKSVRANYKVSDGGVREAPFWVLVGALMPAVLIEIGYISHPDESLKIANPKYQDRLAKGIADGVDEYFAKNR